MRMKLSLLALLLVFSFQAITATFLVADDFRAEGPATETRLAPTELLGAVRVSFDLHPISMSFDLPWHYCLVSENGIKFAHFAAETYDPRNWDGRGADASFEAGMDKEARFARVWIEQQNPARIIVRVRYALTNSKYEIAHADADTDSPYNEGKGDWGDERFTIYPDGTYVRHMTIHTALASRSQPFGFYREPPNVVHEFMESVVIGPQGHSPTDDLHTDPAVILFRMFDTRPGVVFPEGEQESIAYKMPEGPPSDFGDFQDANIMLINAKCRYRPFTIGLPYGVNVQPYGWEDDQRFPFTTWTGYDDPEIGYVSAIGHMINWWHFRRSEKTIEQIYLHGMTNSNSPATEILPLAWSWICPPELQLPEARLSPNDSAGDYDVLTYDQTQKAYVIPRAETERSEVSFSIDAIYDDSHLDGTMWLVNPAFVVSDWSSTKSQIVLRIDDRVVPETDYRTGFEGGDKGRDLVVWLHRTINLSQIEDHRIQVSIQTQN